MHEAFSGSLESAPNSAELLEATPVNHEVFPIDSVRQRTLRGGAVPLASVGQEGQVVGLETDTEQAVATRAMHVGKVLPFARHETVLAKMQQLPGGARRAA